MKKFSFQNPRLLPLFITQGFGENVEYYKQIGLKNGHNGIDLVANDGDLIIAAHDGIVTFAGEDGSAGLGVVIRTNEQFLDINGRPSFWKSIYWHLQTGSICVHASQQVRRGEIIGRADNTGFSTGSHLHFSIKPVQQGEADWKWDNVEQGNGYNGAVDPMPYYVHRFDTDMKMGDKNEEVKRLQERLAELGYFKHEPTGFYGKLTAYAVYQFQIDKKVQLRPILDYYKGKYCHIGTRRALNDSLIA